MKRAAMLAVLIAIGGCFRWQPVALEDLRGGRVDLRTRTVQLVAPTERATMVIHRQGATAVEGWDEARNRERRVELSRVRELRVRESSPVGNALAVGAVYLAVAVVSWLAVVVDLF